MTLGDLEVSRVDFLVNTMAGPAADLGVVGQSILARLPWEISWDRGTVTLGATPWVEDGEVTSIPLHTFANSVESIVARVNGRPLTMMLDTGAFVSAIPEGAARDLGLEVESLPTAHLPEPPGRSSLTISLPPTSDSGRSRCAASGS